MKKTLGLVFIALLFVFCLGTVSGQKNVALVANTIDYNLKDFTSAKKISKKK